MSRSFISFIKGLAPLDWVLASIFVTAIGAAVVGMLWSGGSGEDSGGPGGVAARPPTVESGPVVVPEGPFKPPQDKSVEVRAHIERYQKAIDEDPNGEETPLNYRRIGNLHYTTLNDLEGAIPYYEDVLKNFPDWDGNDKVLINLAMCYERLGNDDMARTTYHRMLRFFKEGTPGHDYASQKLN